MKMTLIKKENYILNSLGEIPQIWTFMHKHLYHSVTFGTKSRLRKKPPTAILLAA